MAETAFGYFPDYDVQWDIKLGRKYKTQIVESLTGKEQRRRLYPSSDPANGQRGGYGTVSATSDAYTPAERKAVADFLNSADGAFRAFYFFRRDRDTFTDYNVGIADVDTSIIIPFKDSTVTSVTVNGVSVTFSVTSEVGLGGEDRINFLAGVTTGIVRVNLRGRERWLVRSLSDEIIETFLQNVMNDNVIVPLSFKQVR